MSEEEQIAILEAQSREEENARAEAMVLSLSLAAWILGLSV